MRLSEISKAEFVQGLQDPLKSRANKFAKAFLELTAPYEWELIGINCYEEYCRIVFKNRSMENWEIYEYEDHLRKIAIPALQKLDKNGTWDARPNVNRTIEVYTD